MPYYMVFVRQGDPAQPIATYLWSAASAEEAISTLADETRSGGEYAAVEVPNALRKRVTIAESPVIEDLA